jgi:hypothetical protein
MQILHFGIRFSIILNFKLYIFKYAIPDAPPSSLMDSTANPKVKTMKREKIGHVS